MVQNSQADFLARRRWIHLTWTVALLISVGIVISLALLSNWATLLVTMAGAVLISTMSFEGEHRMAERLADLNRDLETKVQERTYELEMQRQLVEHLLAEMSHRLGNNLAMVSSYLLLQARRTEDAGAREALQEVHRRILSVAAAQRRLHVDSATAGIDVSTYLKALVDDIRATLAGDGISLELKSETIEMRGSDAVSLGIIVNELVTNALKYAFPNGTGRIAIDIGTRGGEVVLNVADSGRGYDGSAQDGLGSLVVQSMVKALGGRAAHTSATADPQRPGTIWRIQFPLHPPQTFGAKPGGI